MTSILYIAGAGRSGSTLLASVLGQSQGVVDVGEVWKVWRVIGEPGRRCGCGSELVDCRFWGAVADAAPGVLDPEPVMLATIAGPGDGGRVDERPRRACRASDEGPEGSRSVVGESQG